MQKLAIIGGSGLYFLDDLENSRKIEVDTPFGRPSGPVLTGMMDGVEIGFLARHGEGHTLLPEEIPFRANIWALKHLGFDRVVSVSLVGSMKKEVGLGVPVIIDQFIDRTAKRKSTFFGNGVVGHVSMAKPVCPAVRDALIDAADKAGVTVRTQGTYVCIEGPQFSTRAESLAYRALNVDVIGMTNMPEAKLAREARLHYATIALPTDYDCWHESGEDVTVEQVMRVAAQGLEKVVKILKQLIRQSSFDDCGCRAWTANAIMTAPEYMPAKTKEKLSFILQGDK